MDVDYEYSTVVITPASMTRRKRFARKRTEELAAIERDGWEIVDIEPERIFRRGDKVTVKRARSFEPDLVDPVVAPAGTRAGRFVQWWDGLTTNQQIGVGLVAIAILVTMVASF